MTAKECSAILHDAIRHREKMYTEPCTFIGPDGKKVHGTINANNDILYHAMKFALSCVEEKIEK